MKHIQRGISVSFRKLAFANTSRFRKLSVRNQENLISFRKWPDLRAVLIMVSPNKMDFLKSPPISQDSRNQTPDDVGILSPSERRRIRAESSRFHDSSTIRKPHFWSGSWSFFFCWLSAFSLWSNCQMHDRADIAQVPTSNTAPASDPPLKQSKRAIVILLKGEQKARWIFNLN